MAPGFFPGTGPDVDGRLPGRSGGGFPEPAGASLHGVSEKAGKHVFSQDWGIVGDHQSGAAISRHSAAPAANLPLRARFDRSQAKAALSRPGLARHRAFRCGGSLGDWAEMTDTVSHETQIFTDAIRRQIALVIDGRRKHVEHRGALCSGCYAEKERGRVDPYCRQCRKLYMRNRRSAA